METSVLQFIMKSCFTRKQLEPLFPGNDPYRSAVEALLCEDTEGEELTQELDEAAGPQREKIRSMSPRELRSSLSVEFLEPGRRLGIILWALLRDDRLSARSLAGQIVETFTEQESLESETYPSDDSDDDFEPDETLDAIPIDGVSVDIDDDEMEVDQLLADIASEEMGLGDIDDISLPEEDEMLADAANQASDDELLAENDDVPDDVDSFIASLTDEDDMPEELNFDEMDDLMEDSFSDEISVAPVLQSEKEPNLDVFDEATLDKELGDMSELEALFLESESDSESENELQELDLDDIEDIDESEWEMETGELTDEEIESLVSPSPAQKAEAEATITLGGVEISLASLKDACEKVFNENIELVTDKNLTESDKIVVVGKKCGVRVLHGPRYEVYSEDELEPIPTEAVSVSPVSMQAALSRIYEESIELIPDPRLLLNGIVIFAGRETGLAVLQNKSVSVPLPQWVDGDLKDQLEDQSDIDDIQDIKARLSALESAAASGIPSAPAPIAEPEPVPEPETQEDDNMNGSVAEESISLDEIEAEELEPIHTLDESDDEEETGEEPLDDDILAAIAEQEKEENAGSPEPEDDLAGEIDLEELGGEELNLGDLGDDATETLGEEDLDLSLDEDLGEDIGEELSLDDIDLGEGDESDEEDGELDLDSLDLEGLTDSYASADDDSSDGDLDLDVLAELDQEEENGFTPKKVFDGERILLLGGENKHADDYARIVLEIGGEAEWYGALNDAPEEDITEMVNNADVIMTLSSDALSDPGIIQATNCAQENNKRLFQHHSANPVSVQKQLVHLVEEGKI
jgi:hypothetical protein